MKCFIMTITVLLGLGMLGKAYVNSYDNAKAQCLVNHSESVCFYNLNR